MERTDEKHYLEDTVEVRNYNPEEDSRIKEYWHKQMKRCSLEYYLNHF